MFRGSSILRLIDVCFNVLIGFILITDRDLKVQLDLPTAGGLADSAQVLSLLEVHVDADTSDIASEFRDLRDGTGKKELCPIPASLYRLAWETDGRMVQIQNLTAGALSDALARVDSQYADIRQIAIFPHDDSRLEGTVFVYDVCKQLNLPLPAIDLGMANGP